MTQIQKSPVFVWSHARNSLSCDNRRHLDNPLNSEKYLIFPGCSCKMEFVMKLKFAVSKYNQEICPDSPITFLKERQIMALKELYESNKDIISVMPTGYGKSLIFELIPYLLHVPIFIFAPLNVILHQEKDKLRDRAVLLEPNCDSCVINDSVMYVLGHPEDFVSHQKNLVSIYHALSPLIVVDEAHVILEWSVKDFRPLFVQIKDFRKVIPNIRIYATTATANPEKIKKIASFLLFRDGYTSLVHPITVNPNVFQEIKRRQRVSNQTSSEDSIQNVVISYIDEVLNSKNIPTTIFYGTISTIKAAIKICQVLIPVSAWAAFHRNYSEEVTLNNSLLFFPGLPFNNQLIHWVTV